MRVRMELVGGAQSESAPRLTEAFARWLAQDRAVGPYVEIDRMRSGTDEGAMSGGLIEWLALALNSGFSTASLVYSHLAFRASLPPRERSAVRLVVEHGDSRVVVEAGSAEEAAQLANLITNSGLLGARSPSPESGTPGGGDDGAS